ncbi:MAG: bifunctional phosphoribosyl-AMP cyclohydrolase/phosphoribosyl-ATP diphosphatase HisIE [Bacillota bacterium]
MTLKVVHQGYLDKILFDDRGLVPAIVQDASTNEVLMMAYMNRESLVKTLESGRTWFYSRSRQQLWLKGETSGHFQHVQEIIYDCDGDTLLVRVEQVGVACHEGDRTCFHNQLAVTEAVDNDLTGELSPSLARVMEEVYGVILDRKRTLPEGSYTTYLFQKGQDKILKKVGEEAAEVIIASKNNDVREIRYEAGDLLYHLMVLLANHGITLEDIAGELAKRRPAANDSSNKKK